MTKQQSKQLYLELIAQVNDKFPGDYADKTKMANPTLKFSTITNVRYGKSPRLDVLLFMIRVNMPLFIIPQRFLEAEKLIKSAA